MFYWFGLLIVLILTQTFASMLFVAAIRLGIREYFRQKRLYFLEMLRYGEFDNETVTTKEK